MALGDSRDRRALVTGITGQGGSYLAEQLLADGYEVHGLSRRTSMPNTGRIDHMLAEANGSDRVVIHHGDLTDPAGLGRLIAAIEPDEIFHLGAQSHVDVSFDLPAMTFDVTGTGTIRMLEALRLSGVDARLCQACSSEMFGASPPPQSERSAFAPRSPYGIAKLASYWAGVNYREAYGLHIVNGIFFNHESPRRGETFVTRKITRGVARIRAGLQDTIALGNLDARRDWGYAPDYMRAMRLMIAAPQPRDYVIATGAQHSVREFLELACEFAEIDDPESVYRHDPGCLRPADVDSLCGDSSLARDELGWEPSVGFEELVRMMVEADIEAVARGMSAAQTR